MLGFQYLVALALTLAVEVPVYAVLLARCWRVPKPRALAVAVGVNLVTHPVLWWLLVPFVSRPWYGWLLLVGECVVCLVEWMLLAAWLRRRWDGWLLALAAAANGLSVLAGFSLVGFTGAVG